LADIRSKKNCYNKKFLNAYSWLENKPINDKHPLDVALRSWWLLPQQYQPGIKDLLTKSYYGGFFSHQLFDVFNNSVFVSCFFVLVPFIAIKDFSSNIEAQKTAAYEWVTLKEICKGANTLNPFYLSFDQHMIQLETMDVFIISKQHRNKIFFDIEQEFKKQSSAQHNEELKCKDPFDITSLVSKSGEHSLKLFANIEPEVVVPHTDQ
jgi:hypothetical protein